MRVVLITGSYPPDTCGVGDYTFRLVSELQACGVIIKVITKYDWKLANIFDIIKQIRSFNPDIVHIQYPTIGYEYGLAPQALSVLWPSVITLHEVSEMNILRRLSLYPFSIRSKKIIFTNIYEMYYTRRFAPWISFSSNVIPIGSYIPIGAPSGEITLDEVVYFGLIRPKKGIEDVITLASLIKDFSININVRIIGLPDPRYSKYLEDLQKRTKELPVIWDIGLAAADVADLLARSKIAYVPYPDGASERRSSLLALLANGVATITTHGKQTPAKFNRVVEFAQSPAQALRIIERFFGEKKYMVDLAKKGQKYAQNLSWEAIAYKHVEIYKSII